MFSPWLFKSFVLNTIQNKMHVVLLFLQLITILQI